MKGSLIVALSLLVCSPVAALAQSSRAGVVTAIEGQATLTRPAVPSAVAVKFKDDVLVHDRIDTRERSIVRILFGGKAVITVREQSSLTVTEEPGRSVVDVADGKMAVNLAKSRMRPGDVVEIRTPNVVAAIRGSFVVVETSVVGGVRQTDVFAVHVSQPVTITQRSDPSVSTAITSGQGIRVTGLGNATVLMPITRMTSAQTHAAVQVADMPRQDTPQTGTGNDLTRAVVSTQVERAAQATDVAIKSGTAVGAPGGGAPRDHGASQAAATQSDSVGSAGLGDVLRTPGGMPGGVGPRDAAISSLSTSRAINANASDRAGTAALALPGAGAAVATGTGAAAATASAGNGAGGNSGLGNGAGNAVVGNTGLGNAGVGSVGAGNSGATVGAGNAAAGNAAAGSARGNSR